MKDRNVIVAILAAAGCCATASAQDSVSKTAGLPGDAVGAYTVGGPGVTTQRLNYVLDLDEHFGSWGTRFGAGPLIKTSKSSNVFFNSLTSASAISNNVIRDASLPASNYFEWFGPGFGVNPDPTKNDPGSPASLPGSYTQLGAVVAEFGTDGANFNYNGVLGAAFGYDPVFPTRLYVSRVVAAVNQPGANAADTSQFGVGAVDSSGNVAFRADDFGIANVAGGIVDDNYFRTRLVGPGSRNPGVINQIRIGGASDVASTDWLDLVGALDANRSSPAAHNTPNILPANIAQGGNSRIIGSNFNTFYTWENPLLTMGTNQTAAHRPGTGDQRGGVHSYPLPLLGGAGEVAAGAMITQSAGGGGSTDSISIFGLRADGSVGLALTRTRPAAIADNCDSFTFTGVFENYRSQVAARGGNGQVALGRTTNGERLAAAMMASTNTATNPFNAIAVLQDDGGAPFANTRWTLAAWVDTPGLSGKPIYGDSGNDGIPFTGDAGEFDGTVDLDSGSATYDAPIGRLASLFEVTGGSPVGPSLSSPMIDSAGNVWFTSAVALNKVDSLGNPFTDFDSALIRAIHDPIDNCWRLELVVELGDTFFGQNSGTQYQVQFLGVADSNSVSSGTTWSNSIVANGWNDRPNCAFGDPRSPLNLGGLVFNTEIVYDVDGDGDFEDPTNSGGNPNSADQSYQVLMYLGNINCPADFDGSGFVDSDDFDAYVGSFENGDQASDFDCSGFVDGDDFDAFVRAFERGC